jgi:hypothetical protein
LRALSIYLVTSSIAVLGVFMGLEYFKPSGHILYERRDVLSTFANWDGNWYLQIARDGYKYDRDRNSSVGFFPGYPIMARYVASAAGLSTVSSLLLVAHLFLAGSFIVLGLYLAERYPHGDQRLSTYSLLAFGLLPPTFVFRMAYSESSFIFLTILVLFGIERRLAPSLVGLISGAAMAVRPTGIVMLLPFVIYCWSYYRNYFGRWEASVRSVLASFVASWGLIGFIAFQYWTFDEALAYRQTQNDHWREVPAASVGAKLGALLTCKPIWSVYDPESLAYWRRFPGVGRSPLFSVQFANPLYFLVAIGLTGIGARMRWLTRYECLLTAGLLLMPYATRGFEMCMGGHARYAAAAWPIYIVLGQLLCRLPQPISIGLMCMAAFFMGTYAAMFAAWYRV